MTIEYMKLTKESKQLMAFLVKNNHINYQPPSHVTKSILKKLYSDMLIARQYVDRQLTPYVVSVTRIASVSQILKPRFFNANSFPKSVRKHIDETSMTQITFAFSLFGRKVKVVFVLENGDIDQELVQCKDYMVSITTWLYMLNSFASKSCSKTVTIYLYLTSLKKVLPSSNMSVLDETHVNTAFTSSCPVHSEIVVFRREEWFKVFIHETFHSFGLDFSSMSSSTVNKCVLEIYHVHSQVNAYEAYTEVWAEIMNAVFCAFQDGSPYPEFLASFDFYINLERTYSFFQLAKTLRFMGLTYADLISHTSLNLYKEKTNVLAYYVLKTVLLNNYQGFLAWCKKYNLVLPQFNKTNDHLIAFCAFIKRNYKSASMLVGIDASEHFLSRLSGRNSHLLNNMRMSLLELG